MELEQFDKVVSDELIGGKKLINISELKDIHEEK